MMHVAVGIFGQGQGPTDAAFFGRDPGRCGQTDLLSGTEAKGRRLALE